MTESGLDAAVVAFDGNLTLQTIDSVRDELSSALTSGKPVRIDCSAATEVDLSFIQLLLAAKRSALRLDRPLQLAAPADGPLLATLRRSGFVAEDGTEPADGRFWTAGPA